MHEVSENEPFKSINSFPGLVRVKFDFKELQTHLVLAVANADNRGQLSTDFGKQGQLLGSGIGALQGEFRHEGNLADDGGIGSGKEAGLDLRVAAGTGPAEGSGNGHQGEHKHGFRVHFVVGTFFQCTLVEDLLSFEHFSGERQAT